MLLMPISDNYFYFQHKMMLSQAISLLASASIKISRARKDALRPIFTVPAVLRQDPTASSLLGGEDLATLSEKATKEQAALWKVFRPSFQFKGRRFGKSGSFNRFQRNRYNK